MMKEHFPELRISPFEDNVVNQGVKMASKLNHVEKLSVRDRWWRSWCVHKYIGAAAVSS